MYFFGLPVSRVDSRLSFYMCVHVFSNNLNKLNLIYREICNKVTFQALKNLSGLKIRQKLDRLIGSLMDG